MEKFFDNEIKRLENKNRKIYNVPKILTEGINKLETKIYNIKQILNLIEKLEIVLSRYENGNHSGAEEIDIINAKLLILHLCNHLKDTILFLHEEQEDISNKQIKI